MANHYMTEGYMSSILQQYQQNSPQKTTQDMSGNDSNFNQFIENGEQSRRQLNESLFRSIDDRFERQIVEKTADTYRLLTGTPLRAQQMVRTPVITSDSFRRPNPIQSANVLKRLIKKTGGLSANQIKAQSVRSQYFNRSLPQTRPIPRVRPQTYKAKVIDYSNGIIEKISVKPKYKPIRVTNYQRPVPHCPSVLTERNIDPIKPSIRTFRSVSGLHTAISSISQKPIERAVVHKSILKSTSQTNSRVTKTAPKPYRIAANIPQKSINKTADGIIAKTLPKTSGFPEPTTERDSLAKGFETQFIIRTIDLDKSEAFYCFFCNIYFKKLFKVEKHCNSEVHEINMNRTFENPMNNPLNKKFIWGQISKNNKLEALGLKAETAFVSELNRIYPENKHYYYVKGIRLQNPGGPDAYYCRFCEQSIQSLANIERHLTNESHLKNENKTSFSKFLSQTTEPIIGLHYITEYMSPDLIGPVYECSLCKRFENAYDMYFHVCSFRHRLNLLKKLNPNETILNSIKESPQASKEIRKRISDLSQTLPIGNVLRVRNNPNLRRLEEQKKKQSEIEVIDITDDDEQQPTDLRNSLSICVSNEEEAADTAIVIQALKESVVKYYLSKIPVNMRRNLINKVMDTEEVIDFDL